ncbi:hypothetical protein CMEL01_09765 [Colletotrichum melonis]|uniref:Uncharacterized protein n=1 Tax=Colletotrichum melonis TaxID=1209925 RepID=A0AAI9TXY0_9PEZI|nr:hypothetical protein CMEL01_09765 [Colletotrichum melonis]
MEERSLRQSLQSQGASISPAPTSTNDWVVIGIALVSGNFNCLLPLLACAAGATNKTCPSHAVGVGTSVAERQPRQATDGYSTLKGTAIDFHENVVQFNQDVASSEISFVTDSDASWTLPRFLRFVVGLIKLAGEVDRRDGGGCVTLRSSDSREVHEMPQNWQNETDRSDEPDKRLPKAQLGGEWRVEHAELR